MKIKNKKLVQNFKVFFQRIEKKDKIAILHHTDPDGITSAVIMNKAVEKISKKNIDLRINQKPEEISINEETFKRLKDANITKLIITDLCVDQSSKKIVSKIEKFADILIIDHHKLYNDINSEKTVFIKPELVFSMKDHSIYSASKLAYDLSKEIIDVKELDWIAAMGMIGDNVLNRWRTFKQKVFKRYNIKDNKEIYKTSIGKVTETIFLTEAYDFKKVGECFQRIHKAKSYKKVLDTKLKGYRRKVENEIKYWKRNVLRYAEFYPDHEIIFDYIKPRYSIRSAISSEISSRYPNSTIIIAQDMKNDFIQLSVRRQDQRIAVNELLERVLRKFSSANGGGHINSAGGRIRKEDLYRFRNNVLGMMENKVIFRQGY